MVRPALPAPHVPRTTRPQVPGRLQGHGGGGDARPLLPGQRGGGATGAGRGEAGKGRGAKHEPGEQSGVRECGGRKDRWCRIGLALRRKQPPAAARRPHVHACSVLLNSPCRGFPSPLQPPALPPPAPTRPGQGWILELDRGAGIPFEGNYSGGWGCGYGLGLTGATAHGAWRLWSVHSGIVARQAAL